MVAPWGRHHGYSTAALCRLAKVLLPCFAHISNPLDCGGGCLFCTQMLDTDGKA